MGLIAKAIILLFGGKFRREMRKIEKMTKDDPGLQAEIQNFSKAHNDLEQTMELFCKRYPDHDLCTKKGKSRITDVEY